MAPRPCSRSFLRGRPSRSKGAPVSVVDELTAGPGSPCPRPAWASMRTKKRNAISASTPRQSSRPCWSPPPVSPATPAASEVLSKSTAGHPALRRRGPTPATEPGPSTTAPPLTSTSKSPVATRPEGLQSSATPGRRADLRLAHLVCPKSGVKAPCMWTPGCGLHVQLQEGHQSLLDVASEPPLRQLPTGVG